MKCKTAPEELDQLQEVATALLKAKPEDRSALRLRAASIVTAVARKAAATRDNPDLLLVQVTQLRRDLRELTRIGDGRPSIDRASHRRVSHGIDNVRRLFSMPARPRQ